MASARYTLNITPEPPEEKRELTRKEKAQNFFYYYKWHMVAIAVALSLVGTFVYEITSQIEPDYQIGIISPYTLPGGVLETLEQQLTPFIDDRNNDGTIKLSLMEYTVQASAEAQQIASGTQSEHTSSVPQTTDPYMQMAGMTKIASDAQMGQSMLFLVTDVAAYQAQFELFAYNDGAYPPEGQTPDFTRMGVRWGDSPVLCSLQLGAVEQFDGTTGAQVQTLLQDFVLLQRVLAPESKLAQDEKIVDYYNDSVALFHTLTEGAQG